MRRIVVVLLMVLFVASSGARADEASKRAKAEELFTLLHMDQLMDQLTKSVMQQVQTMTQSMPGADQATPEQKKLVADFQQRVLDLVNKRLGWKALEPDFINLYATTYTEEDLDGIIAFYKSPVGQKMLEKTPELMTKSTELTQQRMREVQPEFNQMIQDFMKQMAATTAKPTPAQTAPPAKNGP
ncbi:MAG TPA: DUF2059 domain-containing protein [Acidobacteriaceae bacterium]|nr:DUF2059 domain-containing protein [Acidobacteriaceae bacterium]